jgi:protein-tyrosine kinase
MSAQSAEEVERSIDAELRDALIGHCGLSEQNTNRVVETMRSKRLSFCESAFQLGLATRHDIDEVAALVRDHSSGERPSLIEAAIRSAQTTTALVVREGLARPSSQLIHVRDADSERNEKIRALRTDLMLLNDSAQRGNVLALVSPGRAEGRSQLCAELAIAFAQLGRRTLLVDADLRSPRQHVLFNAENQWGLAQTLALGEHPYLHGVEGLPEMALLTSGTIPPNPMELVSHLRFERLITEFRRQYDFVIIDTPPVSQYADALRIAAVAECVLVVSRAEVTSMVTMKDMVRRLAVTESKILGAVINRF